MELFQQPTEYDYFENINDFADCVIRGGEIVFVWEGKAYGIAPKLKKSPQHPQQILISQIEVDNQEETELWCNTVEELLEYKLGKHKLRDIIPFIIVIDRTI